MKESISAGMLPWFDRDGTSGLDGKLAAVDLRKAIREYHEHEYNEHWFASAYVPAGGAYRFGWQGAFRRVSRETRLDFSEHGAYLEILDPARENTLRIEFIN